MVTSHRRAEACITDTLWAPANYLILYVHKKESGNSFNPKPILKLKETKVEKNLLTGFKAQIEFRTLTQSLSLWFMHLYGLSRIKCNYYL